MIQKLIQVDNECTKIQNKKDKFELFLRKCTEKETYVLKNYFFLEKVVTEIAQDLNLSERTIFRYAERLRNKFEQFLNKGKSNDRERSIG